MINEYLRVHRSILISVSIKRLNFFPNSKDVVKQTEGTEVEYVPWNWLYLGFHRAIMSMKYFLSFTPNRFSKQDFPIGLHNNRIES